MEGTVKWFNLDKGYGFILGDDREDYFLHYKAFIEPNTTANKDDRVSFKVIKTDRGLQATEVKVIKTGG